MPEKKLSPQKTLFGIRVEQILLYRTLTSNPSKTLRAYKRLNRADDLARTFLSELEIQIVPANRPQRKRVKEVHIGPMR